MKNIKKILFIFTIIFAGFCCKMNVLGDTTCQYETMYPFTTDKILTDSNMIDSQYIKYVYIKLLNHSLSEYEEMQNQRKQFYGEIAYFNATLKKNFDNRQTVEEILEVSGNDTNGKPYSMLSNNWYGYSSINSFANTCPDIVVMSNDLTFPQIFKNFYSFGNISTTFYNALTDSYFADTDMETLYNNYGFLLISKNATTRLQMATIYIYTGYYGINLDIYRENINPIIEKYLKINGFEELLKEINLSLDTNGTINSETYQKVVALITNQLSNNNMSINDVENDINELKEFDNTISGGIFNALKSYISPYGLTVSKWYDEYMPGSPSKYIRALLLILPVLNDDEIMQKVQTNKDLDDANRNYQQCLKNEHTLENCLEECQEFYKLSDCQDSSNISACIKAYPSNVCKGKNTSDIQADIDKAKKEDEEKLKDLIGKKMTDIYSNYGINIGESDKNAFCRILLGEGENDGLYPYIRLVLNLIRIAGPILVVLLTAFDGMKVITSFKGDENKKFWNHLKIRLICVVILILVPTIINYVVDLFIGSCPINV